VEECIVSEPGGYRCSHFCDLYRAARHDLLKILEDRYGRRSTIVTGQFPVDQWHALIGDPTYADAVLDRLVDNARRIDHAGASPRRTRKAGRKGSASSVVDMPPRLDNAKGVAHSSSAADEEGL
jgi:hypothetical protein